MLIWRSIYALILIRFFFNQDHGLVSNYVNKYYYDPFRETREPLERNSFEVNRQYCGGKVRELLRQKKKHFDEEFAFNEDSTLKSGIHSACNLYDPKRPFSMMTFGTKSTISQGLYFCDWYPELFGIDEDEIPLTDDEEGLFDIDWDELEFETKSVTTLERETELEDKKIVLRKYLYPKYGRRARQKPILERKNHEKFECLCDIDENYSRHFIARYDKGFVKDERDFKAPQFKNVWEEYCNKIREVASERWSGILESPVEEPEEVREFFYRPTPKFTGSSKKKLKEFREQLLASFRPLDCREVRRYRMPYAEALYLELQEDLYLDCAEFFKNLIIKDYLVHESLDNLGPCLRDNTVMMNRIVQFLKLAERYSRKREYNKEVTILLRSGKYFNDHDKFWWWLAEEFYIKAVKASQKSVLDGGEMEAISHYILGTFLLDFGHRVQSAQEHLLKARELSLGKDWTAEFIVQKQQDPVHKECAIYLCRALIAASKELRLKGKPEEALPHIHQSYKLCEESVSQRWDIEMETLFELGMTYQEVGFLNWAITAFRKYIEIALLQNCTKSLCEGYLELAICYRSLGDLIQCHRYLHSYLKTAEARKDENLTAFGNRYLGEFYLNNGSSKLAAEHFKKAFYSFHKQRIESLDIPYEEWEPEHFSLPSDVELTRVLTGLAEGEALTKQICHLILEAKDKRNQQEILKLIRWKNNQEIEETELSISEEILQAIKAKSLRFLRTSSTESDFFSDILNLSENQEEDDKTINIAVEGP